MPDIDDFIRDQAKKLREKDEAPKSKAEWEKRRTDLRAKMFAAMGDFPDKPCDLEPRILDQATNEIQAQTLDSGKAREVLGWTPRFTLEQGLARTVAWYREHERAG